MSIQDSAFLAHLRISKWTPSKHDKAISNGVGVQHGVTKRAGKFIKCLCVAPILTEIDNAAQAARAQHNALTLPWSDGGDRILPGSLYFDHMRAVNIAISNFNKKTEMLFANWDQILKDEETRLRGVDDVMFNPADFPTLEQLKLEYGIRISVLPFPNTSDFRCSHLGEEEEAKLRAEMTKEVQESLSNATLESWTRMFNCVKDLSSRLKSYSEKKEAGNKTRFCDSMLGNLLEILDVIPKLNITGDEMLDQTAKEIRQSLCQHSAEALKKSPELRAEVARNADVTLEAITSYLNQS